MNYGTKRQPAILLSVEAFSDWIERAPKGSWAVYYTGDLANGRMGGASNASNMGAMAWDLMRSGRYLITQRRPAGGGPSVFEYLIIKRREPKK